MGDMLVFRASKSGDAYVFFQEAMDNDSRRPPLDPQNLRAATARKAILLSIVADGNMLPWFGNQVNLAIQRAGARVGVKLLWGICWAVYPFASKSLTVPE
jgi:hypothetical protein